MPFEPDPPSASGQGGNIFVPDEPSPPPAPIRQEPRLPTLGENLRAAAGELAQVGRGVVSGVLGTPGLFEAGARGATASRPGLIALQSFLPQQQVLPTPERVGQALPYPPSTEIGRKQNIVGQLLGESLPLSAPGRAVGAAAGRLAETVVAPGRTVSRIERAAGPSAVGETIEQSITNRLSQLRGERAEEFQKIWGRYMREGEQQAGNIVSNYIRELETIKATRGGDLSPDQLSMIDASIKRLRDREIPAGIQAVDLERRKLADIENGLGEEGLAASNREFAGGLRTMLAANIADRVPAAQEAWRVYQELSEPINRYATNLGQRVVQRAGEFLPDVPKADVASLPGRFFATRGSVRELKALTGDDALVNDLARRHVANEIQGARTAREVREYMQKNQDWLQELPEVNSQLERTANLLRRGENVRGVGKATGMAIGAGLGIGAGIGTGSRLLRSLTGDR